jgi:ribonuclease HI
MVLRGEDDHFVEAATKVLKGSDDATLAETVCIREALLWVEAKQIHHVFIETDAEVVVKAMEKMKFPRTIWGNLAHKISRDLVKLEQVSVKWVSRKGNQAAHELARYAFVEPNRSWSNFFPHCILSHIPSDMEGVS